MSKNFILASASPRRKELLESIGLSFQVDLPREFQEIEPENQSAHQLVKHNAAGKARDIAKHHKNALILGVDTVGALDDHVLEKPKDHQDAFKMLKQMQGRSHQVLSALCLIDTATGQELIEIESTRVEFAPMTDADILNYLQKEDVMDKAAAYAIQGKAALFVKGIEGSYSNVVGLPLERLNKMLQKFDINLIDIVQ